MWTVQILIMMPVLLVLLLVTGAHGAIRIYSFPSPLYFTNGHTLSITCEHPDNMVFIYWTHPTEGVVSVSQGRKIVTHFDSVQGVGYVSLRINNARQSDTGDYRCHFRQGGMSAPLRANYRMNIMLISPAHTDTVLAVGETLSAFCNASHFNSRQWLLLSNLRSLPRVVRPTSDGRVTISSDMHLQIRSVKLEDQAIYRCALRNELTPREGVNIDVNLTVVVRPVTSVTPEVHVVEEGALASITCHIMGFPLPEVTWRDGRTNLVVNNSVEGLIIHTVIENSTSQLSTLTFSSVLRHQEGNYTCHADSTHYGYSDSATGLLRLAGIPEPPTNVHLSLINQTNILVTWNAPPEVEAYVVSWKGVNTHGSLRLNSSLVTNFTITGLQRLTLYSVTVYATNSIGEGMTSHPTNITTSPNVPGAPVDVVILDVGSESVRVEWSDSLPMDNGGVPIRNVRLSYKEVTAEEWTDEVLEVDAGDMFTVVSGLRDQQTYHIRMEVGNIIGYGPSAISEPFETLHLGYPGSPSHIVARNLTHGSAVVCWLESSFGKPFLSYSVEIAESSSNQTVKIQRFCSSQVGRVQDCDTGVVVTDLNPNTCYRFAVSVRNSQGVGRPSSESDEYCTSLLCPNNICSNGSPTLTYIEVGIGAAIGALFLIIIGIGIVSFFIRTHSKKETRVCAASTTKDFPITELENRETRADLSPQEFEITEDDPNYSTIASLKGTQCVDKFPVYAPVVERRKKSHTSEDWDGSHYDTVENTNVAARNYEEIDLTPYDVSVKRETETQTQKGSETWDPSHIYSVVNKKSTMTAVKCHAEIEGTHGNLYAVVDKEKPKIPPRSSDYEALELNDPSNEMYSNEVNNEGGNPQLMTDSISDTLFDPNYSIINKKTKPNITEHIISYSTENISFEQEKDVPEASPFDLSIDTCDLDCSVINKKTKPNITEHIISYSAENISFEQEEEDPEIPPFDLSMM